MQQYIQGEKIQDIRPFTVGILNSSGKICGTGFIVSRDGKVVTCAHVVTTALGLIGMPLWKAEGLQIGLQKEKANKAVGFVGDSEQKEAMLTAYLTDYDDDVALLQLVEGPFPLPDSQVAILGHGADSGDNRFSSFGFRPLDDYKDGLWTKGEVRHLVPVPANGKRYLMELLQISSEEINQGMSGSAILDISRNLVSGIITEAYNSASGQDHATAWAVNASILAQPPFNLPVRKSPLPRKQDIIFPYTLEAIRRMANPKPGSRLYHIPTQLSEWVGRHRLLARLDDDWQDERTRISSIIGVGGEGKTSLVRYWLEQLLHTPSLPQPDGVFWWSFENDPDVEHFFQALRDFLWNGSFADSITPDEMMNEPERLLPAMLGAGRYLLILDGLELHQLEGSNNYGVLISEQLREFLRYAATLPHQSLCILTSRAPVTDLFVYATFTQHMLRPLRPDEGVALLRHLGVMGEENILLAVVEKWGGYAIVLHFLGTLLKKDFEGDIKAVEKISMHLSSTDSSNERLQKILGYYEHVFNPSEQALLRLCATFRASIPFDALSQIQKRIDGDEIPELSALKGKNLEQQLLHLLAYGILRRNEQQEEYTLHSLSRNYVFAHTEQALWKAQCNAVRQYYEGKSDQYKQRADDERKEMGIRTTPGRFDRLNHVISRAGYMGGRWASRAAGAGDWRAKIIGFAVGGVAGLAFGAALALVTDPEIYKSSAEYIEHRKRINEYEREEQLNRKEAAYYQQLAETTHLDRTASDL
jgi:hypothetical protein